MNAFIVQWISYIWRHTKTTSVARVGPDPGLVFACCVCVYVYGWTLNPGSPFPSYPGNSHTHLYSSECLVMKIHSVTHSHQSTVMLILTVCHYSPDSCSYNQTTVDPFLVLLRTTCTFNLVFLFTLLKISLKTPNLLWWLHHATSKILQVQNLQVLKNWGVSYTPTGTTSYYSLLALLQNITLLFVNVQNVKLLFVNAAFP